MLPSTNVQIKNILIQRLSWFVMSWLALCLPLAAQEPKRFAPLASGKAVEREIAGGQRHADQITLQAGQFLRLQVNQQGIDVKLSLVGPDGQPTVKVNFSGKRGMESLSFEASDKGDFQLLISPVHGGASAGNYLLTMEIKASAGIEDRQRIKAERLLTDALQSARPSQMNVLAAKDGFQKALALWRELNDPYLEAVTLLEYGLLEIYAVDRFLVDQADLALPTENCERALRLMRGIGNTAGEGRCLQCLGYASFISLKDDQAREYYEQALQKLRAAEDEAGEALILSDQVRLLAALNNADQYSALALKAIAIQRQLKDTSGEIATLLTFASMSAYHGEVEKGLESYRQALSLAKTSGDQFQEFFCRAGLGGYYARIGRNDDALENFRQALIISRRLPLRILEARANLDLSYMYSALSSNDQAIEHALKTLSLSREIGNRNYQVMAQGLLGELYYALNQYGPSEEYFKQGIILSRETKQQVLEGQIVAGMAKLLYATGRLEEAIELQENQLPIVRTYKNFEVETGLLAHLGITYLAQGRIQKALSYLEAGRRLTHERKDHQNEAAFLLDLGYAYSKLGLNDRAITNYEQALSLSRQIQHRLTESLTLIDLSEAYSASGLLEKAFEVAEKALTIGLEIKNTEVEARAYQKLGIVSRLTGRETKALDYFERCLRITRDIGNRLGEAANLRELGLAQTALNRDQDAKASFEKALTMQREMKNQLEQAELLFQLARLEQKPGNLLKAQKLIGEALLLVESLRRDYFNQGLRTSYTSSTQNYREFQIDLLMALHRQYPKDGYDIQALEAREKAGARGLLEQLTEAGVDIRQGVDPKLLTQERALIWRLRDRAAQISQLFSQPAQPEQKEKLTKEFAALEDEYQQLLATIRQTSPHYTALTQPQPASLKEIQQQLDADSVLLEYALGEKHAFLWAITRDSVASYELPRAEEINRAAKTFYELLTAPGHDVKGETPGQRQNRLAQAEAKLPETAQLLSQMLISPAAAQLNSQRLIIVADGVLQYLPFAMLPEPATGGKANKKKTGRTGQSQPLLVRHEVISLPSASTLAVQRRELAGRQASPKLVAVLADPVFSTDDPRVGKRPAKEVIAYDNPKINSQVESVRTGAADELTLALRTRTGEPDSASLTRLLFSRDEAEAIYATVPAGEGLKALDFQASRRTAISPDLSQYGIVHFATHGLLNNTHPGLSGLVLSLVDEKGQPQDGFLRLHEIYNLKLNADLVVLSACQTALGKEIKGEGLIGLTRGFMYAGAPRVVASLWKVDDLATAELMKRFYRAMLQGKQRPAAALRAAQLEMMQKPRWQSPFYWAAFTLQGEWK